MTKITVEDREAARCLLRGSIAEDAMAQFMAQVLRAAHDERIKPLRAENAALRAEVERLREALMFYADEAGNGYDVCPRDYGLSYDEGQIIKDAGDRARAALEGAAND